MIACFRIYSICPFTLRSSSAAQASSSFHMFGWIRSRKVFFDPINSWVSKYLKNPADETVINIKLDYIDTASTQSLYQILRQLNAVRKKGLVLMVNWYIENEDPEMKELGEMIEQRLGFDFQYISH